MAKQPSKKAATPRPSARKPGGKKPSPLDSNSFQGLAPYPDIKDPKDLSSLVSFTPSGTPFISSWTDYRIEQVRNYKHWVYIAIRAIAQQVASTIPNISWVSYDAEEQKNFRHIKNKALTPLLAHESLKPVPDKHPLLRLIKDPNDPDTSYDLWYETVMFFKLTGSAYWWTPKNALGLPSAIWVVPSHWMWPVPGVDQAIIGWEVRPVEGIYKKIFLPADEVTVFKDKSPVSKIDGFGPLTAGNQWVDTMDMINRSRWYAYRNGTFPTVAVEFDGKYQDPSDEALRRIEAKFINRYTGETKTNKPLFVPPGAKVTPLSLGINSMLFGETASETRDNILALFGVPSSVVGLAKDSSYGSLIASYIAFMQMTINPLMRYMGQVLSEKIARQYDPSLRVWWEDVTPLDPELTEKQIQTDLMCGAITPNEVRLMRGREPYADKWGDQPIVPMNMTSGPPASAVKDSDNLPKDTNSPGSTSVGGTHLPVPEPMSSPSDNKNIKGASNEA